MFMHGEILFSKGCAVELNENEYKQHEAVESRSCYEWKDEEAKRPGETRKVLDIYVLKPAIALNEWIAKLSCINLASQDVESCLIDGNDSTQVAGNAEVLGFLMMNTGSGEGILFPRHNTVSLSIDSSPWLFGAYRELGALAANKLTLDADGNLQLSSEQIEERSESSREVIDKITALSKTFQEEVREFCKRRGMSLYVDNNVTRGHHPGNPHVLHGWFCKGSIGCCSTRGSGGLLLAVIANRDANEQAGVEGNQGASCRPTGGNASASDNAGTPRRNPGHSESRCDLTRTEFKYDTTVFQCHGKLGAGHDLEPVPDGLRNHYLPFAGESCGFHGGNGWRV